MRDGHDFVAQALEKGAAAALVVRVPDGVAADAPLLIVATCWTALEALGRAGRARTAARVVARDRLGRQDLTKEMLRARARRAGPRPRRREELQQPLGRAADAGADAAPTPISR